MPVASAGSASSAPAPAAAAPRQAPAAGAGDVVAGMGGVVVEVKAKVGQTVAVGDQLVILEAMKMKTPIIATRAGQVTQVHVAAGDAVEACQALVTIGGALRAVGFAPAICDSMRWRMDSGALRKD